MAPVCQSVTSRTSIFGEPPAWQGVPLTTPRCQSAQPPARQHLHPQLRATCADIEPFEDESAKLAPSCRTTLSCEPCRGGASVSERRGLYPPVPRGYFTTHPPSSWVQTRTAYGPMPTGTIGPCGKLDACFSVQRALGQRFSDTCHLLADPDNGSFTPEVAKLWSLSVATEGTSAATA